jgi:hypothetical protein
MWRFLLAGLLTVGGLILLFIGSLGDPATTLNNLHSAFAADEAPITQVATVSEAPITQVATVSDSAIAWPAAVETDADLTVSAVPGPAPERPDHDMADHNAARAIPARQGEPAPSAAPEAAGTVLPAARPASVQRTPPRSPRPAPAGLAAAVQNSPAAAMPRNSEAVPRDNSDRGIWLFPPYSN